MNRPVILLDMDGVIANFVDQVIATFGWDIKHDDYSSWAYHQQMGLTDQQFWARIDSDFWGRIEPYPWARSLVSHLRDKGEVIFATSPNLDSETPSAKVRWLRKHGLMSPLWNDYMIGPHKHLMANKQTILIDDSDSNVEKFRAAGGNAILFPQPWNERKADMADRAGRVVHEVYKLAQAMEGA